jgi:hypothetical protein
MAMSLLVVNSGEVAYRTNHDGFVVSLSAVVYL